MTTREELAYTYTEAGNVIARAMLASLTISLIVVGIQLFMCIYGLTVFLETPRSVRQRRLPYVIINFLFLILGGISTFIELRFFFLVTFNSTSPEDWIIQKESQNDWLGFASGVLTVSVSLLGDGLMLYRCCVVWFDRRLVWILPALVYLASIVFSILFVHPMLEDIKGASTNLTFGSLWAFSSVVMSVLVTALIAFRLIQARRALSTLGVASASSNASPYTGVLAILVESALPFTLIGIGYATILAATKPLSDDVLKWETANYVFSALYFSFAALSPQMIIFRVTTGRSWTGSIRSGSGSSPSQGIVFARDAENPSQGEVSFTETEESPQEIVEKAVAM